MRPRGGAASVGPGGASPPIAKTGCKGILLLKTHPIEECCLVKKLLKEQAPGKQKFPGLGPEATGVSELLCTRVSAPKPPGGSGLLALDTACGGRGGPHQVPSPARAPHHEHPGPHPSHERARLALSEVSWSPARERRRPSHPAPGVPPCLHARPHGPKDPAHSSRPHQAATGPGATRTLGGGS